MAFVIIPGLAGAAGQPVTRALALGPPEPSSLCRTAWSNPSATPGGPGRYLAVPQLVNSQSQHPLRGPLSTSSRNSERGPDELPPRTGSQAPVPSACGGNSDIPTVNNSSLTVFWKRQWGVGLGTPEDTCRAGEGDVQQRLKERKERAWHQGPGESQGWRARKEPGPAGQVSRKAGPGSGPGGGSRGLWRRLSLRGLDGGEQERGGSERHWRPGPEPGGG